MEAREEKDTEVKEARTVRHSEGGTPLNHCNWESKGCVVAGLRAMTQCIISVRLYSHGSTPNFL